MQPDLIQIWQLNLQRINHQVRNLHNTLSEDELLRAERFKFSRHKRDFICYRAILRLLVGCYLGIKPEEVVFNYDTYGKPSIESSLNTLDLRFNISHSEGDIVYAFSIDRELGIDIEQAKREIDFMPIAERFFHTQEVQILKKSRIEQRLRTFYQFWTRKEALIKAIGSGLSYPLHSIDTSGFRSNEWKEVNTADNQIWIGQEIITNSNCVGALVTEVRSTTTDNSKITQLQVYNFIPR